MGPGNCSTVIEAVAGLMVMLLCISYASAGVETFCDGRQNGTLCFGPLGGTVCVKLVDSVSESQSYEIKHAASIILKIRKNEVFSDRLSNKYHLIQSNGTFSIRNLEMTDGGEYVLEIFYSDGKKKEHRTFNLSPEAPVTSVQLFAECLSQGRVNVSCLSEGGNNPQYNWTLNGLKPSSRELFSGNTESNTIVLRPNVAGRLVCSVRTNVSSLLKEKITSTCHFMNCTSNAGVHTSKWVFKESNTRCVEPLPETHNIMALLPIISGALGALLIVLVVSIGIFCVKRKKPNYEENNYNQNQTSADQARRRQEPSRDIPAEYGKVKKQPRRSDDVTYGNMDNCVYGNVDDSIYANL